MSASYSRDSVFVSSMESACLHNPGWPDSSYVIASLNCLSNCLATSQGRIPLSHPMPAGIHSSIPTTIKSDMQNRCFHYIHPRIKKQTYFTAFFLPWWNSHILGADLFLSSHHIYGTAALMASPSLEGQVLIATQRRVFAAANCLPLVAKSAQSEEKKTVMSFSILFLFSPVLLVHGMFIWKQKHSYKKCWLPLRRVDR